LYIISPTTTLLKSDAAATNLLTVVAEAVPDNCTAFGEGIGIVSLAISSSALPVLTVIFGYAIFLYLEG
jgi:hypothetical protein